MKQETFNQLIAERNSVKVEDDYTNGLEALTDKVTDIIEKYGDSFDTIDSEYQDSYSYLLFYLRYFTKGKRLKDVPYLMCKEIEALNDDRVVAEFFPQDECLVISLEQST